jgi:hypothetical protein
MTNSCKVVVGALVTFYPLLQIFWAEGRMDTIAELS